MISDSQYSFNFDKIGTFKKYNYFQKLNKVKWEYFSMSRLYTTKMELPNPFPQLR